MEFEYDDEFKISTLTKRIKGKPSYAEDDLTDDELQSYRVSAMKEKLQLIANESRYKCVYFERVNELNQVREQGLSIKEPMWLSEVFTMVRKIVLAKIKGVYVDEEDIIISG